MGRASVPHTFRNLSVDVWSKAHRIGRDEQVRNGAEQGLTLLDRDRGAKAHLSHHSQARKGAPSGRLQGQRPLSLQGQASSVDR